jgi:hypothetical protein
LHRRVLQVANRTNLLSGDDLSGRINALNYNKTDWRVGCINKVLRYVLKALGGGRYTMLMKYLSYISILRNQRDVIGWKVEPTAKP